VESRLLELARRVGDAASREAVRRFVAQSAIAGRWVIFCGDARQCARFARLLAEEWTGQQFVVTQTMASADVAQRLDAFRASQQGVLIGDAVIEEGLNLQCAHGTFFVDLPFDPMRLEQRLGRLDRMDRRGEVRCLTALSLADPTIAFDTAWYEVLVKGF